jgi:hypothetical protein
MNVDEFKNFIQDNDDDRKICQQVLFSSDMWLVTHKGLGSSAPVYDHMKRFFGSKLSMSNNNVAIVGSAKIGFSLNPTKSFRPFDDEVSDIDVVLVSPKRFSELWAEILALYYNDGGNIIGARTRNDVFRKFVTLKRNENWPSKIFQEWHQTMDRLKRDFFTEFNVGNSIKYRIYESWEAAGSYHESGIRILRNQITGE